VNTPRLANRVTALVLILILAAASAGAVGYATARAPWAGNDSVTYIEAAHNFAAGRGLVTTEPSGVERPLSGFPPLYSILLGYSARLGIDALQAARWLDAGLMAILVASVGAAALFALRQPVLAIMLSAALATSPLLVDAFTGVMAEPLTLTLGTLGLIMISAYAQRGGVGTLLGSAVFGGLALLARHSGIVFPLVGIITILFLRPLPPRRGIRAVGTYALISLIVYIGWVMVTRAGGGTISPTGALHLPQESLWEASRPLRSAAATIPWGWLPFSDALGPAAYPIRLVTLAVLCVALLAPMGLAIASQRKSGSHPLSRSPDLQLACVFLVLSITTAVFVSTSYLLVAAPKPFLDDRILSPLFLGAVVGGGASLFYALKALGHRRLAWLLPSCAAALAVVSYVPKTGVILSDLHNDGRGYTSRSWSTSGILADMATVPATRPLISNDVFAIMYFTGRPAYQIPAYSDGQALGTYTFGQIANDDVQRIFREQEAALVLFSSIRGQFIDLYGEEAEDHLRLFTQGLDVYADRWDGAIYLYPAVAPTE